MVRDNEAQDRRVRLAVLEEFLTGAVPTADSVAQTSDIPLHDVGESFERLAAGRAFVLFPGTRDIRMAAPFAARPSGFTVRLRGRPAPMQANCVWDALGIASMTHTDATIDTDCPCCGEMLRLDVIGDQVSGQGIVHFAVPAARWWDDITFT